MKNGEWGNERGNLNGIIYIFLTYCLLCGFFFHLFSVVITNIHAFLFQKHSIRKTYQIFAKGGFQNIHV